MAIYVNVLGKYDLAYGREISISYTCRHCKENITETIYFAKDLKDCVAVVNAHECPECGECNNLEVDLY